MRTWDNEAETGIKSPAKVEIVEDGIHLLSASGPSPEEAMTAAMLLLEDAHKRSGRNDVMASAISEAAEILNDAVISMHN